MSSGWIKLNRKILEWEHYRNANASRVFLHLLLVADYETGTAVVTLNDIAHKLAITHRMVRTAIGNLEKTREVEVSPQGRNCTEVKIVNWGRYQGGNSNSQTKCQTECQTKCQTECQTETAYVHGVYEKPCQTESQTKCQTNSQTKCQTISTRSKKEVQELAPPESRTRAHEAVSPEDAAEARRLSFRCPYSEADVMEMAAFGGKAMAKEQAENFLGFFAPVWEKQGYAPGRDIVIRQIKKWINQDEQKQKDKEARNANSRPVSGAGRPHRFGDYSGDYSDVKSGDFRI